MQRCQVFVYVIQVRSVGKIEKIKKMIRKIVTNFFTQICYYYFAL